MKIGIKNEFNAGFVQYVQRGLPQISLVIFPAVNGNYLCFEEEFATLTDGWPKLCQLVEFIHHIIGGRYEGFLMLSEQEGFISFGKYALKLEPRLESTKLGQLSAGDHYRQPENETEWVVLADIGPNVMFVASLGRTPADRTAMMAQEKHLEVIKIAR